MQNLDLEVRTQIASPFHKLSHRMELRSDFRNRSSVIRGHETARHKRFLAFFSQPKKSLTTKNAKTQNGLWL